MQAKIRKNYWNDKRARNYKRLHCYKPSHAGIIICTDDANRNALAQRIHAAILMSEPLLGKLISVVRPVR